jgi:hypothetical protein
MFSMTSTKSSWYYRCFYITRAGLDITLAQLDLRDSITDLIPTRATVFFTSKIHAINTFKMACLLRSVVMLS